MQKCVDNWLRGRDIDDRPYPGTSKFVIVLYMYVSVCTQMYAVYCITMRCLQQASRSQFGHQPGTATCIAVGRTELSTGCVGHTGGVILLLVTGMECIYYYINIYTGIINDY